MMHWTTTHCLVPALILFAVTAAGPAAGKDFLSIEANAPAVFLAPRNPGRNFLRLPTLEYMFEIHTHCADSRSPESLSLNVADSRKSLPAEKIIRDGPTEVSLRIPSSQIAPLVVEDFCIIELGENGDTPGNISTQITISAALSAHASLLCAGDEDKAMTYVSRPLDVSLVCESPTSDDESRAE